MEKSISKKSLKNISFRERLVPPTLLTGNCFDSAVYLSGMPIETPLMGFQILKFMKQVY